MSKGKLKDLLSAAGDQAAIEVLESELVEDVAVGIGELILDEGPAMILGGILGAVAPAVNGIRLTYKQKQFERNVEETIRILFKKIEALEANFIMLDDKLKNKFNTEYLGWLLDNLYEEKQVEKVSYHVNGYIKLMNNDINDNLLLMFFNTMNELTCLDVEVLRLYEMNSHDSIFELCERNNLDSNQVNVIKEKLARLGLLASRNDEQRDENLDKIVDYLKNVDKDNRRSKPSGVKIPKITKPRRFESFKITSLGRSYLLLIEG